MNFRHKILGAMASALLALAAMQAQAAAAIASGEHGYVFTATEYADIEAAKAAALEGCAQRNSNCKVQVWTDSAGALAFARSAWGTFFKVDTDPRKAYDKVLADCRTRSGQCTVQAIYWEPGMRWASRAVSRNGEGETVNSYFYYDAGSRAEAENAAIQGCEANRHASDAPCVTSWTDSGQWAKVDVASTAIRYMRIAPTLKEARARALDDCRKQAGTGAACDVVAEAVNPGPKGPPASFKAVFAKTAAARKPIAPSPGSLTRVNDVHHLTCTNQCINGSCVRTFPDGRKERWQASRIFNPLSGNWEWDVTTHACGG